VGRLSSAARFATALYLQHAQVAYRAYVRHDELALLASGPGRRDPYPLYERLRARGPMTPTLLGNWSSTSHEICSRVLRDRRLGVRPLDDEDDDVPRPMDLSFLEMNPPDHTRLRRLVSPAFSPKQMTVWTPRIEKRTQQLLDAVSGAFDLVSAYANPLPIAVISDLLGMPHERAEDFTRYGRLIGSALDGVRSPRHAAQLMRADKALETLLEEMFVLRRREPADDVITLVVSAADQGEVRPAEMIPLCILLLIAGFETTVNLIGNTVLALLSHPEQWRAVADDPTLAAAAVEETLRWDPPVQQTGRVALDDLDIDGRHVHKGQFVVTLLGGANRDPSVHPDPGRFDIAREQHDNLAFSSGIHYCIGQPLARLEATIAIRELAQRFPRLRRAGRMVRRSSTTIRGPLRLPVS
jgi:P450-derived glycosyltransferase activator